MAEPAEDEPNGFRSHGRISRGKKAQMSQMASEVMTKSVGKEALLSRISEELGKECLEEPNGFRSHGRNSGGKQTHITSEATNSSLEKHEIFVSKKYILHTR